MSHLVFQTARKLAEMIRHREVSAVAVLEAHLARVEKYDSKLNAICTLDADRLLIGLYCSRQSRIELPHRIAPLYVDSR